MSFLESIFLPKRKANEFTFQRYLQDLEDGLFRDKMCLGICEANGGSYLLKNFSVEPNALYVGAMGSGKSAGACFSLTTWLASNSDHTVVFIVDAVKGANDYRALFKYNETNHVYPILSSEMGIHRVVDLIYDEAMARREIFNSVKAESIHAYEKITGKKLARIVLMMEEFHSIPYAIMNFERDYKVPQTTANKFHTIMRIGRTMGTWVMAASQKSTKSDIPSEIVPNFTQKQIFRVSRSEAAYILGDVKAADIRSDQKGRCETDYGSVQFPFMPVDSQEKLLEKYVKPLNAECAYLTPQIIKDYLGGKSTEELYKLKKLSDLVQTIESVDSEIVIRILHKALNHKIESVNSMVDTNGLSHVVTWPTGVKVAIMIRVGDKVKVSPKHIGRLSQGMAAYGCTRGIIYTSANDLPQTVYKAAIEAKIELVDHEDLLRLARQIESKTIVADAISPSEIADPAKEAGTYQNEHVKSAPMAVKPILQELLPNNINDNKKQTLKFKRIHTSLAFIAKKEDTFTLLVHPQKTNNGEIFRVLFYVLQEHTLRHRWYVDHKLNGIMDEDTANALEVSSVKEWNTQQETVGDPNFENKILDFFNNFKVCHLPPVVVTQADNEEWLENILKKAPHMIPQATILEEHVEVSLGVTRAQVKEEILPQIKPDKMDMFWYIEKDKLLWLSTD